MSLDEERRARVILSLVSEPGDWGFTTLAHELGGRALLEALHSDPDRHDLLSAAAARLSTVDGDATLARAAAAGMRFVIPGDAEWPEQLTALHGSDPLNERGGVPIGLWVRGPLLLDTLTDSVSIVGSRTSSSYGEEIAAGIAGQVAAAGHPVISGAAFGIDYAAHRGAVSMQGHTVAVLACGADRIYPPAHRRMLEHLAAEHAIVSEAPPGAAAQRVRFLARNRLIAALAKGSVIVEAAARSGALNTANWAQRLNRVVMAVPGPVSSGSSEGAHHLIRVGAATLVTGGADVLELVGGSGQHLVSEPRGPSTRRDRMSVKQRQVLDAVPVTCGATAVSIATVAGLGIIEVRKALGRLEDAGLVTQAGGSWVVRPETSAMV
ncbi:DNA-protecting protein DprA [Nocardioides humilatus]|uniref:DNA-protecting protein DprA n=1 Tax=Nocardioides humilatus TaxID=2607660 RepID=A0A5B1LCW6_9ACTN|nr:DNA-processing protein DprA [Nocardioides humilatus]KAA1418485.1 DNA-protecting protein DprA [Nocardioides humilatus]